MKLPWDNAMKPASSLSRNNTELASMNLSSFLAPRTTIPVLRRAARACTACDLWRTARQTVFGEGTSKAMIMIVGEQPKVRYAVVGLGHIAQVAVLPAF